MCCPSDKEGGKKFSRDFENDNRKVQEFVGFLEQQLKEGHHLLEWLNNADVFYEMQYREVRSIAKVSPQRPPKCFFDI